MSLATLLLAPVLVQVALTFALLFRLGPERVAALERGEVKLADIALGKAAWPDRITQIANAYNHQFELPMLLYVLAVLALVTGKVDAPLVAGAWVFAASRLVHAWIYVTSNNVPQRFRAFVVGAVTLAAMWLWLGGRLLIEGA